MKEKGEIIVGTFKTLENARAFFLEERFAMDNGMEIDELGEDYCVCSVRLTERHKNANGGIQGGAIFTLADLAFAVLSNHLHRPTVAQQVSINYMSVPKGERLIATARCKKNGRSSSIVNVDITDDTGRDVAQFIGTGFKL